MNVLVEGIGSMVFGTQLKYYNQMKWNLIGIDIENKSFGLYKVDKPYIVPKYSNEHCFDIIEDILHEEKIDIVFPTVNEGLMEWSKRKKELKDKYGVNVIISDQEAIEICVDKWNTYKFFRQNNIPTPKTSLDDDYELLKPRIGRGSSGIVKKSEMESNVDMEGYISQQIVSGTEYTIDVLCDFDSNPIYIIPRKRLTTESGVSVQGQTVFDQKIIGYTKKIIEKLKPIGIINIQCFKDGQDIKFIEINPRIGGGCSLSFASSDNWFKAIEYFIKGKEYTPKKIIYDNFMFRYYNEVIVNKTELIKKAGIWSDI